LSRRGLSLFRIGLPALVAAAGVVLMVIGGDALASLGVGLLVISLLVVLANVLVRLAISSQEDRAKEEAARRYFSRTGRWPGSGGSRSART